LLRTDLADPKAWLKTETLDVDLLLSVAGDLAGRPYLWGGTSANALDCSGFTKTAYYMNGFVTPRDASQQVHAGTEVELTPNFGNLLPGDLLFFGRLRDDGSEKITHVGFYTGNGRFLHSGADNGRIMEQSFMPEDPDYAPHRLESLMRARRLSPGTSGVVPVGEAFDRVLE
jgi:cell wall-associated NlpC family hydrolase